VEQATRIATQVLNDRIARAPDRLLLSYCRELQEIRERHLSAILDSTGDAEISAVEDDRSRYEKRSSEEAVGPGASLILQKKLCSGKARRWNVGEIQTRLKDTLRLLPTLALKRAKELAFLGSASPYQLGFIVVLGRRILQLPETESVPLLRALLIDPAMVQLALSEVLPD
jgi:hypothetical protein